jgi:hypothetical protein
VHGISRVWSGWPRRDNGEHFLVFGNLGSLLAYYVPVELCPPSSFNLESSPCRLFASMTSYFRARHC